VTVVSSSPIEPRCKNLHGLGDGELHSAFAATAFAAEIHGTAFAQKNNYATWKQIELFRQTKTPGRTHRARLQKARPSSKTAKRRAWATVNKMTGGGKKSGSGRGKKMNKGPARKGGRKGGRK
jgi:hypothetical protein